MHRLDEPHPFSLESARVHYAADRHVVARRLVLRLELDFEARSIAGSVTHTLEAVRDLDGLTLDAVELAISSVQLDGREVEFDNSGTHLHVYFPRTVRAQDTAVLRIAYSTTPRRGLYFVGPDAGYPKRPRQAWTQGQDEDSRYWFPCLDAPAQKCPSEVIATFPAKLTSLSNGAVVADATRSGRRTMHWRLDAPHSPYLVTLVVGDFEEFAQRAGACTVRTLYPRGQQADARRCVERTPQMVKLFERLTGQSYPWGDYRQVFVADFIFGGMENTGATTLTDVVLHDARAHLDFSAESLISHELAHQWFGDLLTCRDWPHGWLNEGFATWAELLWKEEADGDDEADHQRLVDLDSYLSEVSERYARPIVARRFDAPIDLFDRHLYEKGALVLHELRRRLGDDDFFASVKRYVAGHRGGSVETVDLARAIEQTTGKNLDRFFDEYVHQAGHAKLKVALSFDAERGAVKLSVSQTQEGDARHLELPVQFVTRGKSSAHRFALSEKEHVFHLPCAREPAQCMVDPRRDLLATLEVEKPSAWWREELAHAKWARARTESAAVLGKEGSRASVDALGRALLDEAEFWGTRAACAKALAAARTPAARTLLLKALRVKHPKARRAVVAALGEFAGDQEAGRALARLCRTGDKSVFVEGEAARSLGKVRPKEALKLLSSMLERRDFQDQIRSGALDGLAELRDPAAWRPVVAATKYGAPALSRRAAVMAVARLAVSAQKQTQAVELLTPLLRDQSFRVRLAAIEAAAALGDDRMIAPLSSTPFLDGREARMAREAVRTLRAKTPPKELQALRADLDKLKGEVRALKERIDAKPERRARR